MQSRVISKGEALTIWMAGARHGDGGAHDERDVTHWRDVEVAFERWWGKQTLDGLRGRQGRRRRRDAASAL